MIAAERRTLLLARRDELRERLTRLHEDRTRSERPLEADFAEQAVQQENDEVVDGIEVAATADLRQVEHALTRIDGGLGECCERCGASIDAQRLNALPAATLCRACAA